MSIATRAKKWRGLTLAELLLVAVIGLVIALVIPASVQKVREASKRIATANNLHQLALAMRSNQDSSENSKVWGSQGNFKIFACPANPFDASKPSTEGDSKDRLLTGAAAAITRKIKYTADVHLIVEDFDKAEKLLLDLVKQYQGYLAHSEINGSSGSPRAAKWTVRVPVQRFDAFVSEARKLGVPQISRIDSEDVTAEYVDLEARLKNKKAQEETLRGYLEDKRANAKLKDMLAVEQELARVRGEIEQMEGQRRVLENLTSLTTVTIEMQEIKNYVPPQAPTFVSTAGKTFWDSIEVLVEAGKYCVLIAVALAPWSPFLGLLFALVWLIHLRTRRQHKPVPTLSA